MYFLFNSLLQKREGPVAEMCPVRDLFTDTEAILNLLDLRSIMGCPEGTRLVFTRAFRAKKRTSLYISREKGDHYYLQTRHNEPFFSHYNLLLQKRKEKLARKARVNTERVYRIVLLPPGYPIILSNSIWPPYR